MLKCIDNKINFICSKLPCPYEKYLAGCFLDATENYVHRHLKLSKFYPILAKI